MDIEIINKGHILQYAVHYNKKDGLVPYDYMQFGFKHTTHSFKRAAQRGFETEKIAATLVYGENYFKQGLIYYVLGEHDIPESLSKERDKLKNTVVIVQAETGKLITCYRCSNPHKYIKRKQKPLGKRQN